MRFALACIIGSSPLAAHAAEYKLQPGDVLDFAIMGTENLRQRATVTLDGTVRVPIGGQFKAAGRTIDEVRDDIVNTLKNSSYPSGVDAQGNTMWNVIYPEGVLVDVAEYQPVYVSGDVLTPGSQPFRFGLTVRQAAAVAGGYSAFRSKQDFSLELAGVGQEYEAVLAQYVQAQLRAIRIQAELAGADSPDFGALPASELDAATVEGFKDLERRQFAARIEDRAKQRENIDEAVRNAEARFSYLQQSRVNLEAETKNYETELKRVEELLRKGLTQVARLNDAQRAVFLVSTRSLETSAEVARIERELVDLKRSREKVDTDSRMDNLAALQAAQLSISDAAAKLQQAGERRAFSSRDTLAAGGAPKVVVVRREGDGFVRIDAGEDTQLLPGDVAEISLPPAVALPGAPAVGGTAQATGTQASAAKVR